MGRLFFNTQVFSFFLCAVFSLSSYAEVRVIDHTKESRKGIVDTEADSKKKLEKEKQQEETKKEITKRKKRINQRYVLENRETGDVITFHESTVDEVIEGLRAANVPMPKWHACSKASTTDESVDLEDIEKQLDMNLLIESLAKVPAPELTDSQIDWVQAISPCKADMRLHLKALALILQNYKVIKKPEA